jgi:hypothetical protein
MQEVGATLVFGSREKSLAKTPERGSGGGFILLLPQT